MNAIKKILAAITGLNWKKYGLIAAGVVVVFILAMNFISGRRDASIVRNVKKAEAKYTPLIEEKTIVIKESVKEIKGKQNTVDKTLAKAQEMAQKPTKVKYIVKYVPIEIDGEKWVSAESFNLLKAVRGALEDEYREYRVETSNLLESLEAAINSERASWLKLKTGYEQKIVYLRAFNGQLKKAVSKLSTDKGLFRLFKHVKIGVGGGYGLIIIDSKPRPSWWVGVGVFYVL